MLLKTSVTDHGLVSSAMEGIAVSTSKLAIKPPKAISVKMVASLGKVIINQSSQQTLFAVISGT
jgi:hypothetical protein